jgi:hypothetical protein
MSASKLRAPVAAYIHTFNATLPADDIEYEAFVVEFNTRGEPHVIAIDKPVYHAVGGEVLFFVFGGCCDCCLV